MRLASIHTYPVKGCHRLDHESAAVEPWGLAGHGRWLVVEPDGRFVTQRAEPRLALIRPAHPPGGLTPRTPGSPDLDVAAPADGAVPVTVWSDQVLAAPAGTAADDWLSATLDRKVRLVYLADPTQRPVGGLDPARPGQLRRRLPAAAHGTLALARRPQRLARRGRR